VLEFPSESEGQNQEHALSRLEHRAICPVAPVHCSCSPGGSQMVGQVHKANRFHFHPIAEVGVVFLGIFITMIPALEILRANATQFGLNAPWQYFWMTGILFFR
jgi:hypothetical protein